MFITPLRSMRLSTDGGRAKLQVTTSVESADKNVRTLYLVKPENTRITESYSIVVEPLFAPVLEISLVVRKDSKEAWRKPIVYLQNDLPAELMPLFEEDFHILTQQESCSEYDKSVAHFNFWLQDRVEHELQEMKRSWRHPLQHTIPYAERMESNCDFGDD